MAAATGEVYRRCSEVDRHNPIEYQTQAATTKIYKNAVAVAVAGAAQPCASGVAGQTLLGVAEGTYENPGGASLTWTNPPMIFKQGVFEFPPLASDAPVATDIGKTVYFADDSTVKHTAAANDVGVTLKYITPAGLCGVEIKNP